MEVYGLTGGIGSGKSTVAEMLEDYGIPVVSADELSRMVVAPGSRGLADVVEAFGTEVLDDKGELDRKKMGQIVFTTPERRRQLEAILHPRIRERYEQVLDALEKAGHQVMVYEVPLLFEKKLDQQDEMKGVILVTASTDTRLARVKSRDTLTTDDVLARMRAQMPEQEKRERADYIVHNDGDLDDLRREVEYLISRFLRIAHRSNEVDLEVEPELELDESEIDTISPEEIDESPTAEINLQEPDPTSPAHAGHVGLELEVVLASNPPIGGGPPEFEVGLTSNHTMPPPSAWSPPVVAPPPVVAAPPTVAVPPAVAAPPTVAPPPAVAPPPTVIAPSVTPPSGMPAPIVPSLQIPAVAAPRATPRSRVASAPQMSVPFVPVNDSADSVGQATDDEESPA